MYIFLITVVCSLFAGMLFLNVYFRAKVLKVYGRLVRNEIQFEAAHFFDKEKMEKEIISKHPEHREDIEIFVRHMRYSMSMATVLIALITAFGGILMWYRHGIE